MVLESKCGNWKYLHERWTQLPQDNKSMPMEVANGTERLLLFFDNTTKKVELTDKKSDAQFWEKTNTINSYFSLRMANASNASENMETKNFLTVEDSENLVIKGRYP